MTGMREFFDGVTDREVRMEYYDPGDGKNRLRYEGMSFQGTPPSANSWNIRRFEWSAGPILGDFVLVRIQVLADVAWDNRATLPWLL